MSKTTVQIPRRERRLRHLKKQGGGRERGREGEKEGGRERGGGREGGGREGEGRERGRREGEGEREREGGRRERGREGREGGEGGGERIHNIPIVANHAKPIILYSSCYGDSNNGNERSDVAQGVGLEGSETSNEVKVVGIVECQTTSDVLHL